MSHQLKIGDRVDVHTGFTDSFVTGFEVAELVPGGYRVRRESDGSLLPGHTSEDDLRIRASGSAVAWA